MTMVLGSLLSIVMRRTTSGGRDLGHIDKIIKGEAVVVTVGASGERLRFWKIQWKWLLYYISDTHIVRMILKRILPYP